MTNIAHYWPDVPPAAFSILREIAQARQEQVDLEARAGGLPVSDEALGLIAAMVCEPHADRRVLIQAGAMLVRCIEARDARV
jgi:hypothetical protein